MYSPDRGLTRIMRRAFLPREITAADVDTYRSFVLGIMDTVRIAFNRQAQIDDINRRIDEQASFPLPELASSIGDLLVSARGTVWVQNLEQESPGVIEATNLFGSSLDARSGPNVWDVFDPSGRFRGQVELPDGFTPLAVRAGEAVGVIRDEFDVEFVVVFRSGLELIED